MYEAEGTTNELEGEGDTSNGARVDGDNAGSGEEGSSEADTSVANVDNVLTIAGTALGTPPTGPIPLLTTLNVTRAKPSPTEEKRVS